MRIKLICKEENVKLLNDILQSNNVVLDDDAKILLVEEGLDNPIDFCLKISFKMNSLNELINLVQNLKTNENFGDILIGKRKDSYTPINVDDICFFNSINNSTFANLSNGKRYLIKNKLYQLETNLSKNYFIRINKSELVNLKKINLITPMFKGRLILNLDGYGEPFDISRGYTKRFKERLGL